jgi:hypothetical protein
MASGPFDFRIRGTLEPPMEQVNRTTSISDSTQIRTLLRWRLRIVRGSLSSDSGLLTALVGALLYLAVVVIAALQSWSSGVVTHEIALRSPGTALQLLGMSLLFVTCLQGGMLYFFRVHIGSDFRSAAWKSLPVTPHVLKRAQTADALLNPGAVAALVATTLLALSYWGSSGPGAAIVCLALAATFVCLNQSALLFLDGFLDRSAPHLFWPLLALLGAATMFFGIYVMDLLSGGVQDGMQALLTAPATKVLVRLPPWGIPLFALDRLQSGRTEEGLLIILGGILAGALLLRLSMQRGVRRDDP